MSEEESLHLKLKLVQPSIVVIINSIRVAFVDHLSQLNTLDRAAGSVNNNNIVEAIEQLQDRPQ